MLCVFSRILKRTNVSTKRLDKQGASGSMGTLILPRILREHPENNPRFSPRPRVERDVRLLEHGITSAVTPMPPASILAAAIPVPSPLTPLKTTSCCAAAAPAPVYLCGASHPGHQRRVRHRRVPNLNAPRLLLPGADFCPALPPRLPRRVHSQVAAVEESMPHGYAAGAS